MSASSAVTPTPRGSRSNGSSTTPFTSCCRSATRSPRASGSYRDLRDEQFVLWPRSQSREGYDAVIDGCRNAGFTARVAQECAHPYTTLGLVAAGAGVSVLSGLFRDFRSDVAFVPLACPRGTIYLAWRSDSPSPARNAFVDLVRQVGAGLG